MSEDQFRQLNGIMLILGALGMLIQVYWQLDMKLPTWQRRTACLMVVATFAVMFQYGLAVGLWFPEFSTFALGPRGTVTFFFWIGSIMLWAVVTYVDNRRIKRRLGASSNIFKADFWRDMFGDDT